MGLVLSFAYMQGSTLQSHEYSSEYARISDNTKEIGVLCHWFESSKKNADLISVPMDVHGYINIKQYHVIISPPVITDKGIKIDDVVYQKIKNLL